MKIVYYGLAFIFLLMIFTISARSITSAKVYELKLSIQKEQIMNYELSSHALKSKLRQVFLEKDNFEDEILLNVFESSIMNSGLRSEDLEFKPTELIGIYLINFVRFLVFKPAITLTEDQDVLLNIQYAFYQERRRKYLIAAEKYEELEGKVHSLSEEAAFAYLHNGFCLAMLGDSSRALIKLDKAMTLFPGTHYAENAKLLIGFIKESDEKRNKIQAKSKSQDALAINLYTNGNYKDTLKVLESIPTLTKDLSYIQARSWEELGKSNLAVKSYIDLTNQTENLDIAIKSNRRLLLIGSFYHDNKELVNLSTEKARILGDSSSARLVAEGKSHQKSAKIIQLIQESKNQNSSELMESFTSIEEDANKDFQELNAIIKSTTTISPVYEIQTDPSLKIRLQLTLRDGRVIFPKDISFQDDSAVLKMSSFPITIPIGNIRKISVDGNGDPNSNHLIVIHKNGIKSRISSSTWDDGVFLIHSITTNQETKSEKLPLKNIQKFLIE